MNFIFHALELLPLRRMLSSLVDEHPNILRVAMEKLLPQLYRTQDHTE